jgi:hypothetical protein
LGARKKSVDLTTAIVRQRDLCFLMRETFDLRYAATSFFNQLNFGPVDVLCTRCIGVSFEQATDEPAIANGLREPRMQRYPAPTTTFHVNKVPVVAATEGRGAQDMVVLVLRRRISRVRASHPAEVGGGHVDQHEERRAREG